MSPRRWTEDTDRCSSQTGHFSSEAVLCTESRQALGAKVVFNFMDPLLIRSSKVQHPSTREIPSSKNQQSSGKPVGSGLELVIWYLSGAWSLNIGALMRVRIPTGYPAPCPFLSQSQVLENPRTKTFPVLLRCPLPLMRNSILEL